MMEERAMKFAVLFLLTVSIILFSAGCSINEVTGERQFMLLSEDQDVEMGKSYAPEIEKEMGGEIQNLALQNYIDGVGQKVAAASGNPQGFEYHFTAVEDKMVNAFALPGGYIYITRGMLEKLDSEAQLASILAHETVHVVARHSSAQISREIGMEVALTVASSQTSGGAMQVAGIARQMIGLGYSRSQEKEADLNGLRYMVNAGYDPQGMVQTMQILEAESGSGGIEFLQTHPSPENRVGYISDAIRERGYPRTGLKVGKEDYQRYVLNELKP
jgi:predicted Zn-dependent protease